MPNDLTYGDIPPQIQQYLARPGVNKEKAMQWFSLGLSEPQTYNQAKLLAEAVGNSPEQAKVVAGQWQFESGGGSHMGANHNYFGIQAHTKDVRDRLSARGINVGVGELTDTPEVLNGKKVNTKNKFMEFDNAFDGFQAHRVFLETNSRYKDALAAPTAKDFAKGLEKANYATAPNYGTTLYNNFVLPKEKSPMSGDKRPSSLGKTISKVKLGTSTEDQIPEIVPALPTRPIEQIETNTLGIRPEISTSPTQTNYIPTNSAPIVMPASEAMQMGAPKGWFGSGKSTFNAMGGTMYKQGGGIHINPAHEGDFTAKANAAGMSVQAYASKVLSAPEGQYDPSTRKQANFAKNAAGWNHAMGGNMYANGGSFNNPGFRALPQGVQNKIRSNSFADGGPMAQLTEFNAGGSHENNPLGGIPQGAAPDGGMNLVEQGETKLNADNYIFSKTLKIDSETAKQFNLKPNFVNKDFAEASKIANRKDSRRENDTIEEAATRKDLDNLMNAQEAYKQKVVEKKIQEIQALDPNAMAQIAQSYQPQGMPPQGAPQEGMPQGQPSPEEMAMMQQQGQGQPPMDPAMMQQMMAQQQGAPQMPMQYGGPMSYKCGGGMYEYGGDLSRQFYGGGTMPGSNFSDSGNYYGLNNQGLTTNGLNTQQAAGNNGLSGGQYAQMGLSAVNAGADINRINKSDMSQDAKTSAYGDTASQIGDSTVQTIFPALAPAFAAKNAYQGMLTSNVNPETGEKAYKKGFQASSNEAVTPIHTRQIKGVTDFAKDKSAANFGKMAWNFMDPGSAQLFDSAKGIWGKDKYAENQTAIDLNQKSQEDAYNQQQLGLQQQQQNAINTAVQAGLAGYNQQPQDDSNSNFAKYGGHQFPMLTPRYKDNAGPMGQDLGNLYEDGGTLDGPGDPPKAAATIIAPTVTVTPPKSTVPEGMIENPKYEEQYKEWKAAEDFGWGKGATARGSKALDISDPAYSSWKDSVSGIKLKELYPSTASSAAFFPRYEEPLKYAAAPVVKEVIPPTYGYLGANTGQAFPERGNTMNGKPLIGNRQYSQYIEEAANSPEAIAQRADVDARSNANIQRFATEGTPAKETAQQQNIREKAEFQAKNQQYARELRMKRKGTPNQYAMGGNMNHYFYGLTGPSQMETTGGMNDENYDWTADYNRRMSQAANAPSTFTSDFPSMYQGNTGLTAGIEGNPNAEYFAQRAQAAQAAKGTKGLDTPIEGFKTDQDKTNIKSEHKESLGDFAANMAPIAYNAYQGWLAKQMPLPENMAYHYDPYLQNVNSQLRDADKMGAQAYAALRNMGNPGAIAANLGNITHELALAKAKIREAKENADNLSKTEAAKYNDKSLKDAKMMKYQLEAQMKNAREESRKESLKGLQDYINTKTANEIAGDYNAMAGEGNYSYAQVPYLKGLHRTFAASQAAKNKKKEDNKTV